MDFSHIKTSRDLADLLESVAKVLRTIPEYDITEFHKSFDTNGPQKGATSFKSEIPLDELAYRLPTLNREEAHLEIQSLTIASMRQLASHLQIRIPSKATKSETVSMLMSQIFDLPAGQERIRTFHKRNPSS